MRRIIALVFLSVLLIETTLSLPLIMVPLKAQAPLPQFPEWKYELYGPRVDTYLIRVITNKDSRLQAFETGEIDEIGGLEPADIDRIRRNRPDAFFLLSQDFGIVPLQFNLRRYPISELAIRRAFSHIIDKEGFVIPEILKGLALPVNTIVLPLYGAWYNPNLRPYEFSLQKAEQILDEAGFVRGPDGFRIDPKTKEPLKPIELITQTEGSAPFYFRTGQYIVRQAAKIGLRVTQTIVTTTVYTQKIPNHDFDMYFNGWLLSIYPTFMSTFWHSRNDVKLGTNRYGVRDSRVDELADKFIFAPTEKEAQQILWKLQELLHNEVVPWVPVYTPISVTAYSGKIRGLVVDKVPGTQYPLGTSSLNYLNLHTTDQDFGATYKDWSGAEFANLNPMYYLFVNEGFVLSRIFEPMTQLNPNDPFGERISALAKSWKSEVTTVGGKTQTKITLTYVDNATWHDGTAFTAEDFEWTINVAGNQWKTRRQFTDFSSTMIKFVKTSLVDKNTIEVFFEDTSWNYLIAVLGMRILPKHIYGKMTKEDAQKTDPSVTPHPTVRGLPMLIGTGAYILKEHLPGTSVALSWNPGYYRRHPGKTLAIDPRFDEDNFRFTLKVTDYLKQTVPDATIKLTVTTTDGKIVKEVEATHLGNGVYAADLSGLSPGSYRISIRADKPLAVGTLTKVLDITIEVRPLWLRYLPYIAGAVIVVLIAVAVAFRMRRGKNSGSSAQSMKS